MGDETLKLGKNPDEMARVTGLEPAASGVTGRRSNQLSYTRVLALGAGEAAPIGPTRNRVNA